MSKKADPKVKILRSYNIIMNNALDICDLFDEHVDAHQSALSSDLRKALYKIYRKANKIAGEAKKHLPE